MGNSNYPIISNTSRVFTFKEARDYDKHKNMQPTIRPLCWRDMNTGGTVAFIKK